MGNASALLTDDEKWTFDLHGYLVLPGVIDTRRLDAMLTVIRHWLAIDAADVPKPLIRHCQEPCKTHIDHIQYGNPLFAELASDPEIMRVVCGLMFAAPRLFHCNFTMMERCDEEPWSFHRDDSGYKFPPGFRNPHNDYQANGHDIYCSHIATWVALADVPDAATSPTSGRPPTCRSGTRHQRASPSRSTRGMSSCSPRRCCTTPARGRSRRRVSTSSSGTS